MFKYISVEIKILRTLIQTVSSIVRVDGSGGDVATIDLLPAEKFTKKHPDMTRQVITAVHTALSQLQGLLPGHYVLLHEVCSNFNTTQCSA